MEKNWYVVVIKGTKVVTTIMELPIDLVEMPALKPGLEFKNKTPFISYQHAFKWANRCLYIGLYLKRLKSED